MAVRLWCSAEGLAQLFGEQAAHVGGRHVNGRRDDVDRPLPGKLHDIFAQVGLHRPDALGRQHVVQFQFLGHHRLRLDHALDLVPPGDVQYVAVGFRGLGGEQHLDPLGRHPPLEFHQQLVEVGDGVFLDCVGRIPPLLEIGDGVGHPRLFLLEPADLAQRLEAGARLGEPLGLFRDERAPSSESREAWGRDEG